MYMYFVVGIWLLGVIAIIIATVWERMREKSKKLVYALAIPGTVSIASLFAWLIILSLKCMENRPNEDGIWLVFSILGAIAIPLLYGVLNTGEIKLPISRRFCCINGLIYLITIIVLVCFVYPTVMMTVMK